MRLALVLGQRQQRRVPAVGAQPRRVVDRQPGVVADVGARNALDLVFVEDRRPHAAQVDLRRRRTHAEDRETIAATTTTPTVVGLHGREYYYRRPTCERLYGRFTPKPMLTRLTGSLSRDTTFSMDFIIQLQHSAVMDWVRESGSLLGYPAILFLHTIGLATVAGLNGAIDLRLLGVASRIPLALAEPLLSVHLGGLRRDRRCRASRCSLPTPRPSWGARSSTSRWSFIILALINLQLLKKRVFADPDVDTHPVTTPGQDAGALVAGVLGRGDDGRPVDGLHRSCGGPRGARGNHERSTSSSHPESRPDHRHAPSRSACCCSSLLRRQEALTRVSLEVFYVIALITLPAYLSGVATGMELEKMPDVSVEAIQKHHDGALVAFAFMLLTGLASWLGLWRWRRVGRPVRPQHRHRPRPGAAHADDDGRDSDDGRRDSPSGDDAGRRGADRRADLDQRRVHPGDGRPITPGSGRRSKRCTSSACGCSSASSCW